MNTPLTRRTFLGRSLVWSAMASMAGLPSLTKAAALPSDAAHALILGDWGWDSRLNPGDIRTSSSFGAQSQVAGGMQRYVAAHGVQAEALFLLGDNWYGDLPGGVKSERWMRQFEEMYPASVFPGPAYAMLGNHDYQYLPAAVNKVEAELEYARLGLGADSRKTRWTLPSTLR